MRLQSTEFNYDVKTINQFIECIEKYKKLNCIKHKWSVLKLIYNLSGTGHAFVNPIPVVIDEPLPLPANSFDVLLLLLLF